MSRNRKQKVSKTQTMKINEEILGQDSAIDYMDIEDIRDAFGPCKTQGYHGIEDVMVAQDNALEECGCYDLIQETFNVSGWGYTARFLGYGALNRMTQDGLIRAGVEMRSDEMLRKWIELSYDGREDNKKEKEDKNTFLEILNTLVKDTQAEKTNKTYLLSDNKLPEALISELNMLFKKYDIKKILHDAISTSGYFGGCLIYIDMGDLTDDELRNPLCLDEDIFEVGSLKGFRVIEPFNVAPGRYVTNNPLSKNYFKPETWLVQGIEVHASRFIYIAENKLPTWLLPSYNFFGISLSQIVCDVVHHFTECREAEMRLLKKFSLTVMKTDLQAVLTGDTDGDIRRRIQYFIQNRDNDGLMVVDQETEDIVKIDTPLSGVSDIVKQAMEMVSAYFGEPSVKLWGMSPQGFNATGESDIKNHYDHINAIQEKMLRSPIEKILKILQLNEFGRVDKHLIFDFTKLAEEDEMAKQQVQKLKADISSVYMNAGVIDGEEVRKALCDDPNSIYTDIDPDKEIEQHEGNPMQGGMGMPDENEMMSMLQGMGGEEGNENNLIPQGELPQQQNPPQQMPAINPMMQQ